MDTHILDIIQVIEYENLNEVMLVGHSYGGLVIGGVAEKVPERIRHLVYLDEVLQKCILVEDIKLPEKLPTIDSNCTQAR